MRHHALRQLPDLARAFDRGLRQKTFRLRAIEFRMHAADVIEQLRNLDPPRQHGDVGNERDITHELFACVPRIATEHCQFPLICGEAENRIQRGGLAGAVRTDQSEDPALFDAKIDIIQRDGCAKNFAKTMCFYRCHDVTSPLLWQRASRRQHRVLSGPRPWAILRQEIFDVRP